MIRKSTQRLIHQFIDGEISAQDKKKLDKLLAGDEEAKLFFDSLVRLETSLREDGRQAPVVDLQDPIMKSVHRYNAEGDPRIKNPAIKKNYHPSLTFIERFFPHPALNLFYGLAAGIVLGIVIFSLIFGMSGSSRFEESLMTGTFSPANTPTTAMIPVNLENVRAEIRIDYLRQEYVQITFTVTSEVACNIKLMFNSGNIEIWDVRSLQSKPGCGIMNGYQMVEISNLGDNSYLVLVKKLTAVREELPLEIYIEGNLEYSTNLVIN